MTEGDAGQNREGRAVWLAGTISCIIGLLLAVGQIIAAFLGAGANVTAGALSVGLCILGYYLDSRKLATAAICLCMASILFALAASQGFVPGIEPSDLAFPQF
jgi:hypothetical protein